VVVELTGTEEHTTDGFLREKGVARRVWIERALLEFQDKRIDLVGRAAVCVPHFAAVPPLLQATDATAPACTLGRCALSPRIVGSALHTEHSRH